MIRLDHGRGYDALLLAASREVDPERARLDRHLLGAIASAARQTGKRIENEEAERLVPVLKVLVGAKANIPA